jgi:hypothetical protein
MLNSALKVYSDPQINLIFNLIQLTFVDRVRARELVVQLSQNVAVNEQLDRE